MGVHGEGDMDTKLQTNVRSMSIPFDWRDFIRYVITIPFTDVKATRVLLQGEPYLIIDSFLPLKSLNDY